MTEKQWNKVEKAIRTILAVIGLAGFFLMLGSVGAFDQDHIGFKQLLIQAAIGLSMMGSAVKINDIL